MNKTGKGGAKRGEVRNPNGRPSLLPEVRQLGEAQRNVTKTTLAILLKMDDKAFEKHARSSLSKAERILIKCIERVENDGDVKAAKELIEILTGKLVDETLADELSADERELVAEWRRRKESKARLKAPDDDAL